MHRAVHRVGETLRSTHDINQLLDSLLSTAADAVDADAAIMWRFNATRDELYPAMSIGVPQEELGRLQVGEGVIGLAAERATTIRLPRQMGGPHLSPSEPNVPVVIAVPLYSKNRVIGVMSVYRLQEDDEFAAEDIDTVVFLAEQGGVAIENVLLHDEAQTAVADRRSDRCMEPSLLPDAVQPGARDLDPVQPSVQHPDDGPR